MINISIHFPIFVKKGLFILFLTYSFVYGECDFIGWIYLLHQY